MFASSSAPASRQVFPATSQMGMLGRAPPARSAAPAAFVRRVEIQQLTPGCSFVISAASPTADGSESSQETPYAKEKPHEEEGQDSDEVRATPYEASLAQREAKWATGAAELLRCADELALAESQCEGPATTLGAGMPGFGMPSLQGRQRKMEEVLQRRLKTLRFLADQQESLGSHISGKAAGMPEEKQQVAVAHQRLIKEADALARRACQLAEAQARLADAEQNCVQEVQARQAELQHRQEEIEECAQALAGVEAAYAEQGALLAAMQRRFAGAEVEAERLQAERAALETQRREVEVREDSLRCMEVAWEKTIAQCSAQGSGSNLEQGELHAIGSERLASELLGSETYLQHLHKLLETVVRNPSLHLADGQQGRIPVIGSGAPIGRNGGNSIVDEVAEDEEAEDSSAEASTAYLGEEEDDAELRDESFLSGEVCYSSAPPDVDCKISSVMPVVSNSVSSAASPLEGAGASTAFASAVDSRVTSIPAGIATTGSFVLPQEQSLQQVLAEAERSVSWSPPIGVMCRAPVAGGASAVATTRPPMLSPLTASPRQESIRRSGTGNSIACALGHSAAVSDTPRPAPWLSQSAAAAGGTLVPNAAAGSSYSVPVGVQSRPGQAIQPTPRRVLPGTGPFPPSGPPGAMQQWQGRAQVGGNYGASNGLQGLGFGAQAASIAGLHRPPPSHMGGVQGSGMLHRPMVMGGVRT